MPLYEYECEDGHRFESIKHISKRHTAVCKCGKIDKLLISAWGRVIFSSYDTVVNSNGIVVSKKQSTEQTPYLPEKVHGGRF